MTKGPALRTLWFFQVDKTFDRLHMQTFYCKTRSELNILDATKMIVVDSLKINWN